MDALVTAIAICQFFIEQHQLNVEGIECMSDMRGAIERMHPVLVSLNTQGLAVASGVLENLWQCLENAKRIYVKYIDGYSIRKCWVTPKCIKAKAEAHTQKVHGAFNELLVALIVHGHNHIVQDQAARPAAGNNTAAAETVGDTWEIPAEFISMQRKSNGLPETPLGQGSFGVVGLGYYSTNDGRVVGLKVAVKMTESTALARAPHDPTVLRNFKNEVNFMCTLEHPNICQCFGAVTRKDGDLVLWIVMEELPITLHTAIIEKHLELGRYPPEQYVDIVTSIINAFAYLHTDRQNPIVHRDLKPENVMLTFGHPLVAKLIDFGLAKETRHGVGSTQNVRGTPDWMAPEQKRDGGCSTASDVYAIGLVAEYMWSGTRPSHDEAAALVVLTAEQTPHQFANFNLGNVTLANFTLALIRKCLNPVRLQSPALKHVIDKLKMYLIVSRVHPVCDTSNHYTGTRVTKQ
jgi:hypothetical protein